MKVIYLFTTICALVCVSKAQAVVLLTGSSYSEDFNTTLGAAGVTGHWTSTTKNAIPGTSGWDGARVSGSGSAMNYVVDTGSGNSGAIYSYGTVANERALGTLASGTNIPVIGVEIQNNTGNEITEVTISYVGEYWRSSTSQQNTLAFGYFIGAAGSANYLTTTTGVNSLAALNLVGPAAVGANGALNGNLPENQINRSATISAISILPGQSLYLRWQDNDNTGNDAGLAIDSFQLTAVQVPEPASILLGSVSLIGTTTYARRRLRRRA